MREPIYKPWDLCAVLRATNYSQAYYDSVKKCYEDPDLEIRKKKCMCRVCHYMRGRIGGAMCTVALCGMCKTEMHYGNTCVDVLCTNCATKHKLCRFCGGDAELRNRRKL